MIDTGKLLTNRSNRSTSLSRKSLINIGLIRDDVKKIDGMLKMRLVLSKVREGIEKQNQERLRRISREETIEKDDDQDNDNNERRDIIPKKGGGGGLIGALISGVLSVVGGIVLKFLPQILFLGKLIAKLSKPFIFVAAGSLGAIGGFLSQFSRTKELDGIDKGQLSEKKINQTFKDFNDAIVGLGISLLVGGAVLQIRKARRDAGMMTEAQMLDLLQEMGRDSRRGTKGGFMELMTDDEMVDYMRGKHMREYEEQFGSLLDSDDDDFFDTKPKKNIKKKIKVKAGSLGKKTGVIKLKNLSAKKIFARTGDVDAEKRIFNRFLKEETIRQQNILADTTKVRIGRTLGRRKGVAIDFSNFPDDPRLAEALADPDMARIEADELGRSRGSKKVGTADFSDTSKKIGKMKTGVKLGEQPMFTAPKIGKSFLKQKGGISKALVAIGGEGFAATFKQGLKSAVGIIPFIGDLIGILLDIFVFGEPVGRAIFKGIGSFAIAALLGALGFAVGGPLGAFIGGVAGGIGGDILGGIVYDMFFKSKRGISGSSAATKGVIKGATQSFKEGGFVGKPSFKPMVNSDKSTDLRITASYDRPSAGRVKFIPIPLPIPSKEQSQQEEQIAMNKTTTKTRTFAGLYQR